MCHLTMNLTAGFDPSSAARGREGATRAGSGPLQRAVRPFYFSDLWNHGSDHRVGLPSDGPISFRMVIN
jgi:hypothetical protein